MFVERRALLFDDLRPPFVIFPLPFESGPGFRDSCLAVLALPFPRGFLSQTLLFASFLLGFKGGCRRAGRFVIALMDQRTTP
jgi:hypothetical protein